ncbi:uncharacterized protein MONBRDRAFT_1970, partial [Monosiga brevicollis MX1]
VLTAAPIVVMSQTPVVTSRLVLALISLIMPLEYHADFRPFFTIYDGDCPRYAKAFSQAKRKAHTASGGSDVVSAILGVTNPYFEQAFGQWPTIVRVASMRGLPQQLGRRQRYSSTSSLGPEPVRPPASRDLSPVTGVRHLNPLDHLTGLLLRASFDGLTRTFMIPLERYVARLMPKLQEISPHKDLPRLEDFDARQFLSSLQSSMALLKQERNGDWLALYASFLKSRNFRGWLKIR